MAADLVFTALTPNITTGQVFTTTDVVSGADTYNLIPVSSSMRTLVVITNKDSSNHTVTFTSQADQWGNVGAGLDKIVTVKANKTVILGVWVRSRWADPDAADDADETTYTCKVTYSSAANTSIALINVPNASM